MIYRIFVLFLLLPLLISSRSPAAERGEGGVDEPYIRPHGRVQVRATLYDEDDAEYMDKIVPGDPNNREGFNLRRVRLGSYGGYGPFDYNITFGYDSYPYGLEEGIEGVQLTDAYINYRPCSFASLGAGKAKLPISAQSMTSSAELQLLERSTAVQEMAPGRDVGLTLTGWFQPFEAVFTEEGVKFYLAISNGGGEILTGDNNGEFMYSGRVEFNLLNPVGSSETAYRRGGPALSIGLDGYINFDAESTDTLYGGDVRFKVHRASLTGELIYRKRVPDYTGIETPEPFPEEEESLGYFVQGGYTIIEEHLEIAVRFDWYDGNLYYRELGYRPDYSKIQTYTAGLSYYAFENRIRLQLNYTFRDELEKEEVSNNSLVLQGQLRF